MNDFDLNKNEPSLGGEHFHMKSVAQFEFLEALRGTLSLTL